MPMWMKLGLAVTILILLSGGLWFFREQQRQQQQEVEARLLSIARLKVNQIAQWRRERTADAAVLTGRLALIRSVRRFLASPTDDEASEILRRLRDVKERYHYADILLVDSENRVRVSLSGKTDLHKGYASALEVSISGRKTVWTALHIEPEYPFPHHSVLAPLFSGQKGKKPVGVLVLISDATRFLYPLIQSWPTPSRTSETLLVRRDGDDVLFLNELRHRKDTALKLRIPLSRVDLPAAMAIGGREGIVYGKDYRGVKVVAAILPVQDSPWFMVAKMDVDEAFFESRFRSALILFLMLGAIVLIVTVGLFVRQRNLKRHYRVLYRSEAAVRRVMERHRITLQSIGDAVIATNAKGLVELMNPTAERLTGWKQGEARGKDFSEILSIIDEETREALEDPATRAIEAGAATGLSDHKILITRHGREVPIAESVSPIKDDHGEITGMVLVFRDESRERLAQRFIESRLSLIEYAAGHTLDELLSRALDEMGEFTGSPIGFYHFVDPDQTTLTLQQWSTRTREEFCRAEGKGIHYSIDKAGVWADCLRERRPVVHNDYASLPHKKGLPEGHAEVIRELAVPVMREGKVAAVVGVGNKRTNYGEEEVQAVSYLADITWQIIRQKHGEESLRKSERILNATGKMGRIGGWEHDLETGRALWTQALYDIIEIPYDQEPPGVDEHLGYYPPEDRKILEQAYDRAVREGVPLDLELRVYTATKKLIWCRAQGDPVFKTGRCIKIRGTFQDITERKRSEEALRASEEKHRLLFETSRDAIMTLEPPSWRFTNGNPATIEMFRARDEADFTSRAPWHYSPDHQPDGKTSRDKSIEMNEKALREGSHFFEWRHRRLDGEEFFAAVLLTRFELAGRAMLQATVRDITKQKELEAQFHQAQKMESVGRLAGGVAHDFNNMLSVILGHTELALSEIGPKDHLHAELREIFKAAKRSAEITRQLLAFARKQTIEPRILDLNDTVEGMFKMLRRLIGEDIDLAWQPEKDLWPVKMDPAQIDQIMVNLCVNARDAIAEIGKITIETGNVILDEAYCAGHAGFVPGEFIMLAVSDDGCGMDGETLASVFEPFFTTKEVGRGTGLGLSTVYGIVKQNEGFINAYSEPGKGSTFRSYLPRHRGDAETGRDENEDQMPMGRGETVLVVEDELSVLEAGKSLLERLGYRVLAAGGASEAMEMIHHYTGEIHLLMTDVVMPEMGGKELAEEILKVRPGMRVLFMSGYTHNAIAHQGILDRGVYFLQKPFSMERLARKVRETLEGKK